MGKKEYSVFIGRFQPVHSAHVQIIEEALESTNQIVIVVGSYRAPRSLKNPFSYEERVDMLKDSIAEKYHHRLHFVPARDYLYSMLHWLTGVQNAVSQIVGGASVKMVGHFKDHSSFYLKLFPQWELETMPNYFGANSTDIRECMFEGRSLPAEVGDICHPAVIARIMSFQKTEEYENLRKEHEFLKSYKKRWESSPFPPTFVTTDAVVVQAGHVLLVKRGRNPGIGKYALPGGFIGQNESIEDSCIRELKEETKILFSKENLRSCRKGFRVFDHPARDLRGRTITHAYYFHIDRLGPLPHVEGADDADLAVWVPINDLALLEEEFFSDHLHIINYFIRSDASAGSAPRQ